MRQQARPSLNARGRSSASMCSTVSSKGRATELVPHPLLDARNPQNTQATPQPSNRLWVLKGRKTGVPTVCLVIACGSAALSCGKAPPFPATWFFRRGFASPVEAQPQPRNKISSPPRKGRAFPQDMAAEPLIRIGYNNCRKRRSESPLLFSAEETGKPGSNQVRTLEAG
jgi:hypothetical protein